MKPTSHIRIICLKNGKGQMEDHHQSGFIVSQLGRQVQQTQSTPPSLAYLSARLQDKSNNKEHIQRGQKEQRSINHFKSYATLEMSSAKSIKQQTQTKLPPLDQYFEGQKSGVEQKKSTIRHMMGEIDFKSNKYGEKKIAKTLKQTLHKLSVSEHMKKKNTNIKSISTKKDCSPQNRSHLQSDFHNFLNNKKVEFAKLKGNVLEEENNQKLKKLAIINPEHERTSRQKKSQLNLYRFQLAQTQSPRPTKPIENIQKKHLHIARSRLQKKMFKMTLQSQTDDENFKWSTVHSGQPFVFKTIQQ